MSEFTLNPFAQESGSVQVGPGLRDGTIPADINLRFLEPADAEPAPQDAVPGDGQGDAPQPQAKVLTRPEPRKAATGPKPRTK